MYASEWQDHRASDAEREQATGRLHDAASHGRLSAHELDHRLGAVYSARTRRQLASQLGDLAGATRAGEPRRVNGLSVTFVNSSCRGTRAHVGWWE